MKKHKVNLENFIQKGDVKMFEEVVERFTPIKTERLILRSLRPLDFKPLFNYRNDSEVAQYQAWEDKTEEELTKLIKLQNCLKPGIPGEWFMFGMELKEANFLIGDCAFCINKESPKQAELGITLSRQYQGKGLAKEAAVAVIEYAFTNLEIKRIVAITYKENKNSVQLINSIGIKLVDPNKGFEEGKTDQEMYSLKETESIHAITNSEWLELKNKHDEKKFKTFK